MFTDEVIINVAGGTGGRGCVSFRREKFIPKGGPDGGNGGRGGNVYLIADANTDTLSSFTSAKRFSATKGQYGMGKNCNGKSGDDLYLKVPPGTVVADAESDSMIADLAHEHDQILVARGGRGGYGNAHFKSSTRQKPDFAELGEPGEERKIKLELKLVADVGIIGFPSVGKSTLISVISSAKPKIAAYEFTTLVPNLGVVSVHDRQFIACDIPGLIEGASEGKGLGDMFLRHIERCGILIHLLDANRNDLVHDYIIIRQELEKYSPALAQKREMIVLNKIDLLGNNAQALRETLEKNNIDVDAEISSVTTQGIENFLNLLLPIVLEEREQRIRQEEEADVKNTVPVLTPHISSDKMGVYRIEKQENGSYVVRGNRLEQFTKMTDFLSDGALLRFKDVLDRIGVTQGLERAGAQDSATVWIGSVDVSKYWKS